MKRILLAFILISIYTNTFSENKEIKSLLILDSQELKPYTVLREVIIKELNNMGYIQGKNIIIDHEVLGNFRGKGLNILRSKQDIYYDVIFLNGTVAGLAAKDFIYKENPPENRYNFIFGNVTDPIGIGLIESFNQTNNRLFAGKSYIVDIKKKLRLIQKIFGKNLTIGYVYAEMPQSQSYNKWLKEALKDNEFKDINIIFRSIEFVKSDGGHKRMTIIAKDRVLKLDNLVDVFMAPNDQMGISTEFSAMVYNTATKPLIGLHGDIGVAFAYENNIEKSGKDLVKMITSIFEGEKTSDLISTISDGRIYLNREILEEFNIKIQEDMLD